MSPNTYHISDTHFDNILTQLNHTAMINKTDLQEISKEFEYGQKTGNKKVDDLLSGIKPYSHLALWLVVAIVGVFIIFSLLVYFCTATSEILKCFCPNLYRRRRRSEVHESTEIQDRIRRDETLMLPRPTWRGAPEVPKRRSNHPHFSRELRPQSTRSLQVEERL
jgi:hypothetical protein